MHAVYAVLLGNPNVPLSLSDGSMTLDSQTAPYANASAVISTPARAVLAKLDPNTRPRVQINGADTGAFGSTFRTFDLIVTDSVVDHNAGTTTLTLASDDVALISYVQQATDSSTYLAVQTSVKQVVQAVVGKVGATLATAAIADADFTTLSPAENLVTNGSFEANFNGWTGANSTLSRVTTSATSGSFALDISSSDTPSYATSPIDLAPGGRYTMSGTFQQPSAQTGATNANARGIAIVATVRGATTTVALVQASNTTALQTLRKTFTLPKGATDPVIRLYNGAAAGRVRWDSIMVLEGDGLDTNGTTPVPYFDGNTPATTNYGYAWTEGAGTSTSTRTPLFDRSPDNLIWSAGVSAWDFLQPILTAVGLRLFCDEVRVWHLVSATYTVEGLLSLVTGFNLYSATDSLGSSLTDPSGFPLFLTAAIVVYSWTDRAGVSRQKVDTFGDFTTGLPPAVVEYNRPYPGPGAAKYIVTQRQNSGHSLDLSARVDWSATPGQQSLVSLPNLDSQLGAVAAITWALGPADDMQIRTRGLNTIKAGSFYAQPAADTFASIAQDATFSSYPA